MGWELAGRVPGAPGGTLAGPSSSPLCPRCRWPRRDACGEGRGGGVLGEEETPGGSRAEPGLAPSATWSRRLSPGTQAAPSPPPSREEGNRDGRKRGSLKVDLQGHRRGVGVPHEHGGRRKGRYHCDQKKAHGKVGWGWGGGHSCILENFLESPEDSWKGRPSLARGCCGRAGLGDGGGGRGGGPGGLISGVRTPEEPARETRPLTHRDYST